MATGGNHHRLIFTHITIPTASRQSKPQGRSGKPERPLLFMLPEAKPLVLAAAQSSPCCDSAVIARHAFQHEFNNSSSLAVSGNA